jgi:hypothetical protein
MFLEHNVVSSSSFTLVKISNLFVDCRVNCKRLLWMILDMLLKFDVTMMQLSLEIMNAHC